MTRFFFHIRDGQNLIRDEEGIDLPDIASARAEAIRASRDMLGDAELDGSHIQHQVIEIRDAGGTLLSTVSVAEGAGGRA